MKYNPEKWTSINHTKDIFREYTPTLRFRYSYKDVTNLKNNNNYNKDLILDSNLGKITTSIETNKIFFVFLSKLKSQNLAVTFNHEVMAKNILEAPTLRVV